MQDKATGAISASPNGCGRSSGVEHNLAKVRVESSNLFARSNWSKTPAGNAGFFMSNGRRLFLRSLCITCPAKAHFVYRFAMRFAHSGNASLSIAALPHLPLSKGKLEFPPEIEA